MHRGSGSQRTLAILALTIGAAALLLITTSAWSQSFRGSIRGTVTDPSGSVIAGAKVSAKSIGTGLQSEASTGADGGYVLAELPPAHTRSRRNPPDCRPRRRMFRLTWDWTQPRTSI